LPTGEMVYFIAATVVLYNKDENSQRHYLGHTDDIKRYAKISINQLCVVGLHTIFFRLRNVKQMSDKCVSTNCLLVGNFHAFLDFFLRFGIYAGIYTTKIVTKCLADWLHCHLTLEILEIRFDIYWPK
jgi:hypothetical protein